MFNIDILILICGLLSGYLIYSKGVNDGIALEKGREVAIVPRPIKKSRERKKEAVNEKEEKEKTESIENMMDYNGFKQKVGE